MIDEPKNVGSVVVDATGHRWVREADGCWWCYHDGGLGRYEESIPWSWWDVCMDAGGVGNLELL